MHWSCCGSWSKISQHVQFLVDRHILAPHWHIHYSSAWGFCHHWCGHMGLIFPLEVLFASLIITLCFVVQFHHVVCRCGLTFYFSILGLSPNMIIHIFISSGKFSVVIPSAILSPPAFLITCVVSFHMFLSMPQSLQGLPCFCLVLCIWYISHFFLSIFSWLISPLVCLFYCLTILWKL